MPRMNLSATILPNRDSVLVVPVVCNKIRGLKRPRLIDCMGKTLYLQSL